MPLKRLHLAPIVPQEQAQGKVLAVMVMVLEQEEQEPVLEEPVQEVGAQEQGQASPQANCQ
jgi:hypothetical protein